MINTFIDCGFYIGNALKIYIENGVVDESWAVYAFEANPDIDVKAAVKPFPMPIKMSRKAVWVKDGRTTFHISGRHDAAGIADLTGHSNPKEVKVSTIDFSRFIAELPDPSYIICSMDIEGAEFQVLEKMLAEGTIDRISILDIEFHHRFMVDYESADAEKLIRAIRKRGVKVKLKVAIR